MRRKLAVLALVLGLTVLAPARASAQAPPPPPPGVIALWHADGNFVDSAGQNNLTPKGNVTFVPGQFGSAFNFDGGSFAEGPAGPGGANATLNVGGPFTIAAWVKIQGITGTAGNAPIVAKWGDGNAGTAGYGLFAFSGGGIGVVAVSNSGTDINRAQGSLPTGKWTHVAGVFTGSELRVYVNGALAGSTPYGGGVFATNVPVMIGGYDSPTWTPTTSGHLIGAVDEAAIWNRALTGAEIQSLAAPSAPQPDTIVVTPTFTILASGQQQTFQAIGFKNGVSLGPVSASWSIDASGTTEPADAQIVGSSSGSSFTIQIGLNGGALLPGVRASIGSVSGVAPVIVPYVKRVQFLEPPITDPPGIVVLDVTTEHTAVYAEAFTPSGTVANVVTVTAILGPGPGPGIPQIGGQVTFASYDPADEDPGQIPGSEKTSPPTAPPNNPTPFIELLPTQTNGAAFPPQGMVGPVGATPNTSQAVGPIRLNAAMNRYEAVVSLTTSMTPGDNYRVVALVNADHVALLKDIEAVPLDANFQNGNPFGRLRFVNDFGLFVKAGDPVPDNTSLVRDELRASPLLTVWRTLHIEIDSMDPVALKALVDAHEYIVGDLTGTPVRGPDPGQWIVNFQKTPEFRRLQGHAFTELFSGVLVAGGVRYSVVGFSPGPTARATVEITIVADSPPANQKDAVLRNNDDDTLLSGAGRGGADWMLPLLEAVPDGAHNVYGPCFITPVFDGGGTPSNNNYNTTALNTHDSESFQLNLFNKPNQQEFNNTTARDLALAEMFGRRWQSSSQNNSPKFLTNYLFLAFEPSQDADIGPQWLSGENPAKVAGSGGIGGAVIYLETTRDAYLTQFEPVVKPDMFRSFLFSRIAAHEMGHMFGLKDIPVPQPPLPPPPPNPDNPDNVGIMSVKPLVVPQERFFTAAERRKIRAYTPATRDTIAQYIARVR